MASAMIHIAVAKLLENELNIKNKKDYYLGSIAPDISKQIGLEKYISHFASISNEDIPIMENFTKKYPHFKKNDFDLGYYIHLYTDKLWYEDFKEKIICNESIRLLDGTIINLPLDEIKKLVYQDYTNLNVQLIDEYGLELSLFYEDFKEPKTNIKEIPVDKLNTLVEQMGIILINSYSSKEHLFDLELVKDFIKTCHDKILNELKKY